MVIEGLILHLVSGYLRFTLVPTAYNEESSVVDKRFEISNLDLIRDIDINIKLEKVLFMLK